MPVVIDTDFGGDPDDAVALVYALRSRELDVRAVITSDEYKTNHRARLVQQWLKAAGYHIPVFSGHDLGNKNLFLLDDLIEGNEDVLSIFQGDELKKILTNLAADNGRYVSIGGLSNLSYLHVLFPKLWSSIQTTIMGGAVHYHRPGAIEHNIGLDVQSARTIFKSGKKNRWVVSDHTFVPELSVDATHRLYSYFAGNEDFFHMLVRTNMDRFFRTCYPDSRMHDPLTISALFLPTVIFSTQRMIMSATGEFVTAPTATLVEISASANYDCFWADIDAKLFLSPAQKSTGNYSKQKNG